MHWKTVDNLITKYNELVLSISTKTAALFNKETDVNDPDHDNDVDTFLKSSSPLKKKKTIDVEESNNVDVENDESFLESVNNYKKVKGDDDAQIEKVIKG